MFSNNFFHASEAYISIFCDRHLIEKISTKTYIAQIVKRLNKYSSLQKMATRKRFSKPSLILVQPKSDVHETQIEVLNLTDNWNFSKRSNLNGGVLKKWKGLSNIWNFLIAMKECACFGVIKSSEFIPGWMSYLPFCRTL